MEGLLLMRPTPFSVKQNVCVCFFGNISLTSYLFSFFRRLRTARPNDVNNKDKLGFLLKLFHKIEYKKKLPLPLFQLICYQKKVQI